MALPKGQGVIPLPPFKAWLADNIPAVYDNTLTYYEELCALLKYLQDTVVPAVNDNAAAITMISEYVDHYFDNLDVQEEINNKLDEMVESGELQRILDSPATTESIGGVIIGDGLNVTAAGKISVKAGDDVTVDANGVNVGTHYLDVVETSYHYTHTNDNSTTDTTIHYAIIPGTYKAKAVMSDPDNVNTLRTGGLVAAENKATVMINAGLQRVEGTTDGVVIIDHVLKQSNNVNSNTRGFLTIDDNGKLGVVSGDASTETIVAGGYKDVIAGWYALYANGSDLTEARDPDDLQPRAFIAQKSNGDYLVGVCSGRTTTDTGMSTQNIIDFLFNVIGFTPSFVYNLDGGGSANLLYRGIRQNKLVANEDRGCPNWIVFTSDKSSEGYLTQAINNDKMIADVQNNYPQFFDASALREMLTFDATTTIDAQSYAMKDGATFTLNMSITTSQTNVAYSNLFEGLPVFRGLGNIYFSIANVPSAGTDVRTYLGYLYYNNGVQYLRTRFSLPAGTYCINISYPCQF